MIIFTNHVHFLTNIFMNASLTKRLVSLAIGNILKLSLITFFFFESF